LDGSKAWENGKVLVRIIYFKYYLIIRIIDESSIDEKTGQRLFTPRLIAGKPNFSKVLL